MSDLFETFDARDEGGVLVGRLLVPLDDDGKAALVCRDKYGCTWVRYPSDGVLNSYYERTRCADATLLVRP